MRIHVKQLPCPEPEFRAKLSQYITEKEAHKNTVGVPAPLPEFEAFRVIAENGGIFEIYDGDESPADDRPAPVLEIERIERENPITHRALRELILTIGQVYPAGQNTVFYKRVLAAEQAIQAERAKL